MKRINNIYNKILDISRLDNMYNTKIKINTKNKRKLEIFEEHYAANICNITEELRNKKYIPGKYNIFMITEPKLRLVMSQSIKDKLVNHLVSKFFLIDVFDKTLINENIATRINKGSHYGVVLLKKYLNELKDKNFYVLKFDISKYFYNIDHKILKSILNKKIKDNSVLDIIYKIIDSTDSSYINETINKMKNARIKYILKNNFKNKDKLLEEVSKIPIYNKGKGLPIGNMSSQILAILYLNELDHYIKNKLKIKYYIRYMDDGIIIHENKDYLIKCLKEIEAIINCYELKLNNKTCIVNIKQGIEFLGFNFSIRNDKVIVKVRQQTKKKFKRKLKSLKREIVDHQTLHNYMQVKSSYLGHLNYANANGLIKSVLNK